MAKLILSMDGQFLKEFPLLKERMGIGRKAHNDIQIDNLAISGEHAEVLTILGDSFLEDLNSTNGTLVNGQPVKKYFLKNGDLIELGKYRLSYVTDQAAAASAPASSAAPAPVPAAVIQVLSGANAGRELDLVKTLTTLGRPGVQVAVIARRPQGYFITHVEGAQFPVVNGRTLDAQAHLLADHDVIDIAGVKMEFFLKN